LKKYFITLASTISLLSASVELTYLESIKIRYSNLDISQNDSIMSYNSIFSKFENSLLFLESQIDENFKTSALIVSKDGYIISTYNKEFNFDKVVAKDINGKEYIAKLIDHDLKSSIALFKIDDIDSFKPIAFTNSSEIKRGDFVFGVDFSSLLETSIKQSFISNITTSSISSSLDNKFLFDSRGGLILVDRYITSNQLKDTIYSFTDALREKIGLNGAIFQDIDDRLKEQYKRDYGVLLKRVNKNSLASNSGLKDGDLLISCNGDIIKDSKNLLEILEREKSSNKIVFEYIRDKEINLLSYSLSNIAIKPTTKNEAIKESTTDTTTTTTQNSSSTGSNEFVSGLYLKPLNDGYRKEFGILPNIDGVFVSNVDDDSYAKELGFRVGDVVIEIEGKEIRTIDDFNSRMKRLEGIKKRVFIVRDNWTMILVVK
jgi:serine protease Do